MTDQNPVRSGQTRIVGEALLVAMLTFIAYAGAFLFKYCYLHYFDIPIYFVQITLSDILGVATFGFVYLIAGALIIEYIFTLTSSNRTLRFREIALFIFVLAYVYAPSFISLYTPVHPIWALFKLILVSAFLISISIYLYYEKSGALEKSRTIFPRLDNNGIIKNIEKAYGAVPVLTFFILVMFIFDCATLGTSFAQDKTYFLIPNNDSETAIISNYSDGFLGIKFDPSTRILKKEIEIIPSSELEGVSFNLIYTGVLYSTSSPSIF